MLIESTSYTYKKNTFFDFDVKNDIFDVCYFWHSFAKNIYLGPGPVLLACLEVRKVDKRNINQRSDFLFQRSCNL